MNDYAGATGELVFKVDEEHLATRWGNNVPVLATPIILWWTELACMNALDGKLRPDEMSVGIAHEMQHLAPTPLAAMVQIRTRLESTDGKRLRFSAEAHDGIAVVARGYHERAVVSSEKFITRLEQRAGKVV